MGYHEIPKSGYSFRKAYRSLPADKQNEFIEKLMSGLGIISKPTIYKRINGQVQLMPIEMDFIRQLFLEYNIEKAFDYEREELTA